jgi:hypothetical protein
MKKILMFMLITMAVMLVGCDYTPNSDQVQQHQQEKILAQGAASLGMPGITNFEQKRQMKLILETLDKANLVTYAYTYNQMDGRFRFWGETLGYGLPAATQYTSPEKVQQTCDNGYQGHWCVAGNLPQADPNGLFMPSSTDATWILMKNPQTGVIEAQYVEPHITITSYKMSGDIVETPGK